MTNNIDKLIEMYRQGYKIPEGYNLDTYQTTLTCPGTSLSAQSSIPNSINDFSYLIIQEGFNTYAINGITGEPEFTDTNSLVIIQSALNKLTSGRNWNERIVAKGIFSIDNSNTWLSIPDYTIFDLYGKFTATDSTKLMISIFGDNVEINYGKIDGNRISNNATIWSGFPTGTGVQQTIPHGLPITPTILELQNIDNGANPYISKPPDTTNIYITATLGLKYRWRAIV